MAIGAHLGAKMAPSWPWRQDVPKMANLGGKIANLAHFLEHLGDLCWILGAILPKMAKTKKTTTVHHFGRFFPVLEAKMAHLGAMSGHVGAILEQLGDEIGLKSAKMSQESGQERQHEPT